MPFNIGEINDQHITRGFKCGEPQLDSFLKNHALKNAGRHLGKTYVLTEEHSLEVLGFYTLTTGSVDRQNVPLQKADEKLPYRCVGTAHIGRLAVVSANQKRGLGKLLLVHALCNCCAASRIIGCHLVEVESKKDAKEFYIKHGFKELLDDKLHLYMPMSTVEQMVEAWAKPVADDAGI